MDENRLEWESFGYLRGWFGLTDTQHSCIGVEIARLETDNSFRQQITSRFLFTWASKWTVNTINYYLNEIFHF